ncbi:hypothetical protein HDK77DRAFT_269597 [Phyllosticta capitalensis]
MYFFHLVAAFVFLRGSFALPSSLQLIAVRDNNSTSNTTVDADPSWVSAPNERGTLQLVIRCLTTLWLCAWTALHPRVISRYRIPARTLSTIYTILGPEIRTAFALMERWKASRMREEINSLGGRAVDGFDRPDVVSRSMQDYDFPNYREPEGVRMLVLSSRNSFNSSISPRWNVWIWSPCTE